MNWTKSSLAEAGLLILLSIMNFIHAVIITKQGRWYSQIDIALARTVGAERVKIGGRWGSHRLYATLHFVLCSALLAVALALLFGVNWRWTPPAFGSLCDHLAT
jgi:hypothetical protein